MSKNRFAVLLVALRFDNPADRVERSKQVFHKFIANSQTMYSPGAYMCVDEISFRGRCRYKMYLPNKPCKYGLKIMCMTDARNHYFYNGYVYTGKDSDGHGLSDEEKNWQNLLKR